MIPLELQSNGAVEACGPNAWEPGEESAEIMIRIIQGPREHANRVSVQAGEPMWEMIVGESDAFVPGAATGFGLARVRHARGRVRVVHWSQTLAIDPSDSDSG